MTGKLYQFMDFKATDFTTVYPDIKPGIGGVWHLRWDQYNPGRGQFDNAIIQRWLDAEAKNLLWDGTPKPLMFMLLVHTAPDGTDAQGVDYSPAWVKAQAPSLIATAADGSTAKMPAYNSAVWWAYLAETVQALGAFCNGQAQIIYVLIGHGCDAELWAMKAPWNAKMSGGVERMFATETVKLFDVYKAAFPTKPLLARATPGSGRKTFTLEAIRRGIGVQMCGAQVKAQNAHGWGNEFGTWDMLAAAHDAGVPAVAETTTGMGSPEARYWTILGMLGMHVDAMDCHPEWFKAENVDPAIWNMAAEHMGKTATTAPGAFVVLRDYDTSCAPVEWTGSNGIKSGQSDWPGDFEYFMARTSPDSDAKRVEDYGPSDAFESRQSRLVERADFSIDDAFAEPPYEVSIRWLENRDGQTMTVDDGLARYTVGGIAQDAWTTVPFTVKSRTFTVTSDAGVYIHMLYAKPTSDVDPDVDPDPELDVAACWAAVDGAQEDIDNARRECYLADCAVGEASASIAEAARALQAAVSQHEEVSKQAVAAMETLDLATGHLADLRAELEKVS